MNKVNVEAQELTSKIYELVDVTQELVDAHTQVHGARDWGVGGT